MMWKVTPGTFGTPHLETGVHSRGMRDRADMPHNPEYSLTQGPPYTSYVPRERIRGLVGYYPTQWQCQARWQRALGPRDLTRPLASRSGLHVAVIGPILCSQSL